MQNSYHSIGNCNCVLLFYENKNSLYDVCSGKNNISSEKFNFPVLWRGLLTTASIELQSVRLHEQLLSFHFTRQITSLLYSLHFHYVINPRNQILKLFFSYHYFGSKLSNTADILIIYQSETRKICKLELYINFEQITSTLSSYV